MEWFDLIFGKIKRGGGLIFLDNLYLRIYGESFFMERNINYFICFNSSSYSRSLRLLNILYVLDIGLL